MYRARELAAKKEKRQVEFLDNMALMRKMIGLVEESRARCEKRRGRILKIELAELHIQEKMARIVTQEIAIENERLVVKRLEVKLK
jgi:hypothetical protein